MVIRIVSILGIIGGFFIVLFPNESYATPYGAGSYGSCQYSSCEISLSSNGSVAVNVTPNGASTTCTVASDSVDVTTSSSTGYTLTLADFDTSNQLTKSGGGTIGPTSGTDTSPSTLDANSWGYRVDDAASFGSGPTSAVSNGGIPSLSYAAVPPSSGTANTIAYRTDEASAGDTTSIWYGVCINLATENGAYSDEVVYTAVIN